MSVVGLVPARKGSKGIPRKNVAPLGGKPLVTWTLEAAAQARSLDRVVVSTDDEEVAELARERGAEVLARPSGLAVDGTPMLDVVRHALDELGPVDVLVLLQPTSPLRRAEHVDAVVRLLHESGADAVVSVVEVPHQLSPSSLMRVEGERLVPVEPGAPATRQEKPLFYARNGPAVLALRADRLGDDLYGGDIRPYVMAPLESIDVDGPDDLRLAELLLLA